MDEFIIFYGAALLGTAIGSIFYIYYVTKSYLLMSSFDDFDNQSIEINGEYVCLKKVENIYIRSLFVAQIFVDGYLNKDCLVAVVVPDEFYLMQYCKQNGLTGTFKEFCKNSEVKKLIMNDLKKVAENSGLMYCEKINNIYLHHELFSLENGFIKPTTKFKREHLRNYFKNKIDEMYEELERINSRKVFKFLF